eukprot:Unigene4718_Nuclearia_a/m.14419 Unigene4718_Nuclearia_a/g.14419  ORF Unigene4718_Nuclearia_a/g.14419 Unigene4718_Nuclearia_a/m.14419 type:complete len:433 (+) Unigene4718_Nuclearia_a:218-1516(+)
MQQRRDLGSGVVGGVHGQHRLGCLAVRALGLREKLARHLAVFSRLGRLLHRAVDVRQVERRQALRVQVVEPLTLLERLHEARDRLVCAAERELRQRHGDQRKDRLVLARSHAEVVELGSDVDRLLGLVADRVADVLRVVRRDAPLVHVEARRALLHLVDEAQRDVDLGLGREDGREGHDELALRQVVHEQVVVDLVLAALALDGLCEHVERGLAVQLRLFRCGQVAIHDRKRHVRLGRAPVVAKRDGALDGLLAHRDRTLGAVEREDLAAAEVPQHCELRVLDLARERVQRAQGDAAVALVAHRHNDRVDDVDVLTEAHVVVDRREHAHRVVVVARFDEVVELLEERLHKLERVVLLGDGHLEARVVGGRTSLERHTVRLAQRRVGKLCVERVQRHGALRALHRHKVCHREALDDRHDVDRDPLWLDHELNR